MAINAAWKCERLSSAPGMYSEMILHSIAHYTHVRYVYRHMHVHTPNRMTSYCIADQHSRTPLSLETHVWCVRVCACVLSAQPARSLRVMLLNTFPASTKNCTALVLFYYHFNSISGPVHGHTHTHARKLCLHTHQGARGQSRIILPCSLVKGEQFVYKETPPNIHIYCVRMQTKEMTCYF